MPNAKPVRIDGERFDSARNAAAWLRGMGHPKASGAGISLAISRGQREYLGRAVEWAADVRTIAELAARPSALHSFKPGNLSLWVPGAFPPDHRRSVAITGYSGGHPFVAFAQYEAGKWRAAMPGWMEIEAPQWWAELPESKR